MSKKEKIANLKVLDDYDDELPPEINLIDIEKETQKEDEDAAKKKWREDYFINNPKYRNSPIPEDLLPEYKRRTPTPTFDMIKEDLEQKEASLKMEVSERPKKMMKKGGHHPFIVPLILLFFSLTIYSLTSSFLRSLLCQSHIDNCFGHSMQYALKKFLSFFISSLQN